MKHVSRRAAVALHTAVQPENTTLQKLNLHTKFRAASLAGAALAPAADAHLTNRLCSNVRAKAQKAKALNT